MTAFPRSASIAVIGAGTMGAGIAQVAAAAGHPVWLYDAQTGSAAKGRDSIAKALAALAQRGKIAPEAGAALTARIHVADRLSDLKDVSLVIEAIVEDLAIKNTLFAQLEGIVGPDVILATNTSSISVTAIASGLIDPTRVVGLHFFNPAPIMKLVEVVSGITTSRSVSETVFATAQSWGKIAVHTKNTPGFIVNRVARAFYGEPLRLAEEGVADLATLDAMLCEGGGFRMGPFALMDLIGNDVSLKVSQTVFDAYHHEPRFRPSLLQRELVDAGHYGRKSGRGFYAYTEGAAQPVARSEAVFAGAKMWDAINIAGEQLRDGVLIALTDGRTARDREMEAGCPVLVLDFCSNSPGMGRVGFAKSPTVTVEACQSLVATLAHQGFTTTELPDWPGLVVMRTVAMIANEAFEAVLHGVASEQAVDDAMRYGVNYPSGPLAWARGIGLGRVLAVLDYLHAATGDMRYRASYGLRRAGP
jgi:3-hydroxybutyryl-CoA dehydrogenase